MAKDQTSLVHGRKVSHTVKKGRRAYKSAARVDDASGTHPVRVASEEETGARTPTWREEDVGNLECGTAYGRYEELRRP